MSSLRTLQLILLSLLGGVVLGALAGLAFFFPGGMLIGAVFGLVIGIVSLAITAPALAYKRLRTVAIPAYAPAAATALASGAFGPDVAVPLTGAALGAGALAAHCVFPNTLAPPRAHPHCRKCGLDVGAVAASRCPECGARIGPAPASRRASGPVVAWLVIAISVLLALGYAGALPDVDRPALRLDAADPPQLMHHMGDADAGVRRAAAARLASIDPRLLLDALAHPNESTRREAARSLGDPDAANPWALPGLIDALNDRSPYVRAEAARSLGILGDTDALPALRERLAGDESEMVVRAAREAIARLDRRAP